MFVQPIEVYLSHITEASDDLENGHFWTGMSFQPDGYFTFNRPDGSTYL